MAWNGILVWMLSEEKPPRPQPGDFPPEGWSVHPLIPVPGQDDGKRLWMCGVVAMGNEDDAYMDWTTVQEVPVDEV